MRRQKTATKKTVTRKTNLMPNQLLNCSQNSDKAGYTETNRTARATAIGKRTVTRKRIFCDA